MITAEQATETLRQVNQGEYKPTVFATTSRRFTPTYPKITSVFELDLTLVPVEYVNDATKDVNP